MDFKIFIMDNENVNIQLMSVENATPQASQRASLIPPADAPFHGLINRLLSSLIEDPLPLAFTTIEEITSSVEKFNLHFTYKYGTSATLVSVNSAKSKLVREMAAKGKFIKSYIAEDLGESVKYSFYLEFGFKHENKKYQWPKNAEDIRKSGPMLLKAIQKYGMQERKFGLSYWKNILEEFIALDDQTLGDKGEVSISTSDKNIERGFLTQVIKAVILLTKGMYPYNWEAQLKKRGFFKDRY